MSVHSDLNVLIKGQYFFARLSEEATRTYNVGKVFFKPPVAILELAFAV
jgi:hypothetical protein